MMFAASWNRGLASGLRSSLNTYRKPLKHRASYKTYFAHQPTWKTESRAIKGITYIAGALTVSLLIAYYWKRTPHHVSNRKQLDLLPHHFVDEWLQMQVINKLREVGIIGIDTFISAPFTMPDDDADTRAVAHVFDSLQSAAVEHNIMGLRTFYVISEDFVESTLNKHPYNILVHRGEIHAAESTPGIASMLAPRIARKVFNHDAEQINQTLFTCLTTVPAILFGGVALRSRLARRVAVPCLLAYFGRIAWQYTGLMYTQEDENDAYTVYLLRLARLKGTEAIDYRQRLIEQGQAYLDVIRHTYAEELAKESPVTRWVAWEYKLREAYALRRTRTWVKEQQRHLKNLKIFNDNSIDAVNDHVSSDNKAQGRG